MTTSEMNQSNDTQWPPSADLNHVQELEVALEREFPAAAESFGDGLSRRRWLQLMGASMALGGIVGCRDKVETIAPFAFRPENRIPGVPQQFATVVDFCGTGRPVLALCHDGRPTKLDGNPDFPNGQGSDVFMQASILDLYDPDRSQFVRRRDGEKQLESSYDAFLEAAPKVEGLYVLAEPNSSPTLASLKKKAIAAGAKWFEYTPVSEDNRRDGTIRALGKAYRHHYRFEKSRVIVTLDADPFGSVHDGVANTAGYTQSRDPDKNWMSRMYSVESVFSTTGSMADHRIALNSHLIGSFVADLETAVGKLIAGETLADGESQDEIILNAMAKDLVANKGGGMIIAGDRQSAGIHARVLKLNETLGNLNETIEFTEPADIDRKSYLEQIQLLAADMKAGKVKNLLILGGNPVYDAPSGIGGSSFGDLLGSVDQSFHHSVMNNETSRWCSWHINAAHALESWGDAIAHDGSYCVAQPLIAPLFKGRSQIELLAELLGEKTDALEMVRGVAKSTWGATDFDTTWNVTVRDGFLAESKAETAEVSLVSGLELADPKGNWKEDAGQTLELVFETSRSLYDGRFCNNGWMQELPDQFTKLTWDNALLVSPRTANELKLKQGKKANITIETGEVTLPVMIQPGHANGTLSVEIGYGRTAAGRVGGDDEIEIDPVGQDVYPLRTVDSWHFVEGKKVVVNPTSTPYMMAVTQEAATMDAHARREINRRMGKDSSLIRRASFESYQEFKAHEKAESDSKDKHARRRNGKSPLTNVSLPIDDTKTHSKKDDGHAGNGKDDHSHDHGHGHHWPTQHHDLEEFDLTPGTPLREDVKWGMSIDLNKCTGCNSCVIACQSENNIPIVGKEQVWRGREMHWLRIDRYYPSENRKNGEDYDEFYERFEFTTQPVTCHQCENAPCEQVCPVAATVHSDEGLNDMVYNRCIGTRYCGNNCPYKVRRFNYLNYSSAQTFIKYPGSDAWPVGGNELAITGGSKISAADKKLLALVFNPEVTVRSRGVMEKCTYCVQRIQNTKIQARNEKRPIGPNEITTACQDACPSQAIEFGNLADKESRVHAAHADARSYVMLQELNNKPRTRYLARVTNPHPDLVGESKEEKKGH